MNEEQSKDIPLVEDERIDEAWEEMREGNDDKAKLKALRAMLEDQEPNYKK